MNNAQMLQYRSDFQSDAVSWARGLVVAGAILLVMDLLPFFLLYQGALDGSRFWAWWVGIQGAIGVVWVAVGGLAQRVS